MKVNKKIAATVLAGTVGFGLIGCGNEKAEINKADGKVETQEVKYDNCEPTKHKFKKPEASQFNNFFKESNYTISFEYENKKEPFPSKCSSSNSKVDLGENTCKDFDNLLLYALNPIVKKAADDYIEHGVMKFGGIISAHFYDKGYFETLSTAYNDVNGSRTEYIVRILYNKDLKPVAAILVNDSLEDIPILYEDKDKMVLEWFMNANNSFSSTDYIETDLDKLDELLKENLNSALKEYEKFDDDRLSNTSIEEYENFKKVPFEIQHYKYLQ